MNFLKKWWLTICFITLTFIFMTIIIIPISITSRNALTGLAHEIMVNISSYTLDKSENYLRPAEKAAELTRFLADSNIVSSEDPQSMINYFYQQITLYGQFTSIYYGNIKGEFYMASKSNAKVENGFYTKQIQFADGKRECTLSWLTPDQKIIESKVDAKDSYDPRARPWFIDAIEKNTVIWTAPYLFFTGKKPGITTASPVYDKHGVIQGVVGVDISLEELSIFLSKLTIGQNGKAFIVNSSGDVVAFPDLDELKKTVQNSNKIRLSKISELNDSISRLAFESLRLPPEELPTTPVFTTFVHNDKRYSTMFTPFNDHKWPWIIGIYIPEDDYLGNIKESRDISIFIALIAVFLTGAVGWTVARKIEKSKKDAIAANNSKSQFLAVMSHEIRTPMNVILGATDLLKNSSPNKNQASYIKLLANAGEGLLNLLNDILDMSKVEAGLVELENISFAPKEVLRQAFNVFSIAAKNKRIKLELDINQNFPDRAIGDPLRLKQVLLNLIGNAVKFTSDGGVYVKAKSAQNHQENHIELIFTVEDTGPGIAESQQNAIFESFTQADKSVTRIHEGTGLGLSISKNLSKMMGGDILVKSSLGEGSIFTFTATVKKDNFILTDGNQLYAENQSCHSKKVLIIEDNKSNLILFEHYLQDSNHTVYSAINGEEGLKIFYELKPDIVFMDIEMPVMDGYETTREIRSWEIENGLDRTTIIALTAHAIKGTEKAVKKAGCSGYMTKPVSKAQLLEKIEHTIIETDLPS
ncbi:ATP-binding protein [Maridesulfovibrio zosterae]|uniref:ATP-binding protein n=1 Tax=Maridesulfovibrio zosterae TaxID=82171 RepID=UPI00042161F8|nr:ATP-binding protein [Maridesulfovibrio zosterae]